MRGTKRYVFDYHCELKWQATITDNAPADGDNDTKYKGTLQMPEISSVIKEGDPFPVELPSQLSWAGVTPAVPERHSGALRLALERLEADLQKRVKAFVTEYRMK